MDMAADFTLKVTLPPASGKGAAMSISVMPGYQSGHRLASLKCAMVSCGEALIWTLRCTIAIVDLPFLYCRTPCRDDSKSMSTPRCCFTREEAARLPR